MRFDLSLLRCVVSLGVFVGLTASTAGMAFAETNLEAVVHDCPNGSIISSLSSQLKATEEKSQYELARKLAIQDFTCSENANVNKYSRKLAKLSYADDLFAYAGDDNLPEIKRYALFLHMHDVYKEIIESGGFPAIAAMAEEQLPLVDQEIKLIKSSP
jgi:hypothetical protein